MLPCRVDLQVIFAEAVSKYTESVSQPRHIITFYNTILIIRR